MHVYKIPTLGGYIETRNKFEALRFAREYYGASLQVQRAFLLRMFRGLRANGFA
jgi:hypothetical protein